MSKQISNDELSAVVSGLLRRPNVIQRSAFSEFMTNIAQAVCRYTGGAIAYPATQMDENDEWLIGIHADESLPADGGVWKDFDLEGSLQVLEPWPDFNSAVIFIINGKDQRTADCKNLGAACVAALGKEEAKKFGEQYFAPEVTGNLILNIRRVDYMVNPENEQWNMYDRALAEFQGWNLFEAEGGLELQQNDDLKLFENDQHAAMYVKQSAAVGNLVAKKAIQVLVARQSCSVVRYGLQVNYPQ